MTTAEITIVTGVDSSAGLVKILTVCRSAAAIASGREHVRTQSRCRRAIRRRTSARAAASRPRGRAPAVYTAVLPLPRRRESLAQSSTCVDGRQIRIGSGPITCYERGAGREAGVAFRSGVTGATSVF